MSYIITQMKLKEDPIKLESKVLTSENGEEVLELIRSYIQDDDVSTTLVINPLKCKNKYFIIATGYDEKVLCTLKIGQTVTLKKNNLMKTTGFYFNN